MKIHYWNCGRKLTQDQIDNGRTWVAALRSGRFKRGFGVLCLSRDENDSYCCLGVAWEVFGFLDGANSCVFCGGSEQPDFAKFKELFGFNFDETVAGYVATGRRVGVGKTLMEFNDLIKLDFNQIANIIESYMGL